MRALTVGIWLVSCAALGVAGVMALMFGFMVTSMDPSEMITSGIEPWTNALMAAGAFLALAIVAAIALRLWHSRRFKLVGLVLTAVEVCAVAWASVWMAREYF